MNRIQSRLLSVFILISFSSLGGCGSMSNVSANSNITGLSGEWQLTRIKADTNTRVPEEKAVKFTISFGEEGRAYGKVACNNWKGPYHIDNNQLALGAAATTKKLCPIKDPLLKSLEKRFLTTLKKGVEFKQGDIELALMVGAQETWYFTPLKN